MDEFRICTLRPRLGRLVELVRKDAHANRDGDALGGEELQLTFPIQTTGGDSRVRLLPDECPKPPLAAARARRARGGSGRTAVRRRRLVRPGVSCGEIGARRDRLPDATPLWPELMVYPADESPVAGQRVTGARRWRKTQKADHDSWAIQQGRELGRSGVPCAQPRSPARAARPVSTCEYDCRVQLS